MDKFLARRSFLKRATFAGVALSMSTPVLTEGQTAATREPRKPPQLDSEMVLEFVRSAHANLERSKEMLDEEPGLVNATWNWGGGDWETALGGASHMGRGDIAR